MGFKDSMGGLAAKLRLNDHYKSERLALQVGVLAVTGVLVLGLTSANAFTAGQTVLSSQALYTASFVSSKTETSGEILDVYSNEDRTRIMVMMKFSDTEDVSLDAATYQAFLTGTNAEGGGAVLREPDIMGEIITFGANGYVGVILESPTPYEPELMRLTMRANETLVYSPGSAELTEEMRGDASFLEYDQWNVVFNPGASGVIPIDALDSRDIDPTKLFYETVISGQEFVIRDQLDAKLVEMQVALNRIQAETEKLRTTSVGGELALVMPEVPALLDGDEVTGEMGTLSTQMEEYAAAKEAGDDTVESPFPPNLPADTDLIGTGEDSTLYLNTSTVLPGGYAINWRDGNVYEGYLESLALEGETLVDVVQRHGQDAREADRFESGSVQWLLTNGRDIREDYRNEGQVALKPLLDISSAVTQAWQDYYDLKLEYQVEIPSQLIALEMELRTSQTSSVVNADKDVLTTY